MDILVQGQHSYREIPQTLLLHFDHLCECVGVAGFWLVVLDVGKALLDDLADFLNVLGFAMLVHGDELVDAELPEQLCEDSLGEYVLLVLH